MAVIRNPGSALKHFEEEFGGLMGVQGAEFRRELKGGGLGRDVFKRGQDGGGGHLRCARTDEDVVDRIEREKDAGVADEAGGADLVPVAMEHGADEGAEVGGAIDDEHAMSGMIVDTGRGRLAEKGEDRFLLAGVRVDDGVEHRELEDLRDECRLCGEADVATAFAEISSVAHEEPDAGTVDASSAGNIEHDALEFRDDSLEGGFEGVQLVAEDNVAGAMQDEDVPAEALFDLKGHTVLRRMDDKVSQGIEARVRSAGWRV
jgi:hypothetical protein